MQGEPLVILHVEDNSDHANLVARCLGNHRVANEIHLAEDGRVALDYLHRQGDYEDPTSSPTPHVILLDLRLPKVDGIDVLKSIKSTERLKEIPVVVLTSSETDRDILGAYQHHANSYLVKPMDFDKFTQMMEQLGFYWLGWNRYPWSAGES